MASMLGVDAASREREDRKQAERDARHRSAIQAIKDFKFDGGDESSIKANAIRFLGSTQLVILVFLKIRITKRLI